MWPVIGNRTNHTCVEPFYMILPFIIIAVVNLVVSTKPNRQSVITSFTYFVCVLGVSILFVYKQYNIMLNYEEWLSKGMPSRFSSEYKIEVRDESYSSKDLKVGINTNKYWTFCNTVFCMIIPEELILTEKLESCFRITDSSYVFRYSDKPMFNIRVITRDEIMDQLLVTETYMLSDLLSLYTITPDDENIEIQSDNMEYVDLGSYTFIKVPVITHSKIEGEKAEISYAYGLELLDHYMFFYNNNWNIAEFEQMLSTFGLSLLACGHYPYLINENSFPPAVLDKMELVGDKYPEYKNFLSQDSFTGVGVDYRILDGTYYLVYKTYGSGIPIVSGRCFAVDAFNEVMVISNDVILSDQDGVYSGVNPVNCHAY